MRWLRAAVAFVRGGLAIGTAYDWGALAPVFLGRGRNARGLPAGGRAVRRASRSGAAASERLSRMRGEVRAGRDTFERKLRYLLWIN